MTLEEAAHDAGESGLAICLSKPLMRLGKLPLLMQSIFYKSVALSSDKFVEADAIGDQHGR